MARLCTPQAIAWNREHAAIWAARAEERREAGGVLNCNIAAALDLVVRDLLAAIPAGAPDTAVHELRSELRSELGSDAGSDVVRLEARLAACEPRPYPGTTIMLGVGPIMDGFRHDLRCKIAALKGEPLPADPAPIRPAIVVPPAEALPFKAGPQLDLFACAA